jgi:uncharacterized membrane protein
LGTIQKRKYRWLKHRMGLNVFQEYQFSAAKILHINVVITQTAAAMQNLEILIFFALLQTMSINIRACSVFDVFVESKFGRNY